MSFRIDRIGHLGDGVTMGPAGPLFVPGVLPGEEVEGTPLGDKLTGVKILTPSPDRVKPPCAHARTCGGCLMQHASDAFVAGWKTSIIAGALAGQGLEAPMRPILTSPPRSRRRAVLAGMKTRGGVMLGFHARGSDTLVAVPNCQLLHPDLMAAFPALSEITHLGGTRGAELSLTVTRTPAGADVAVTGGKALDPQQTMQMARLVEAHGLARLTWNGEVLALRAMPMQRLGKALVPMPPGAFLQATEQGEAALVAAVGEAVGPARRIVDLFCGMGTFTLPLAEQAEVLAFESDPAMIQALDKGARNAEGLRRIAATTRDLFRRPLEPDEFKGVDAVVIDPPRAGAEAQTHALAKARVPVVAAVSCNPATFARDARILTEAGYRLDWVQPVDQFRWSSHVELAARMSLPA